MRRYVLGLLLPLFLGCAGKNTVAGADKTKAEQLQAAVPSWCTTVCQRLTACAASNDCSCSGDDCSCTNVGGADCVAECQATMAAFTKGDDNCATIGQSFKSCIDGATCDGLVNGRACQLTKAQTAACPKPGSSDGDGAVDDPGAPSSGGGSSAPNAPSGGSSTGPAPSGDDAAPSSGTAGSANTGDNDVPTTGVPVSCQNSYGTGGGSPADPAANGSVLCEEGMSDCTDGHEYSWLCAKNSTGEAACSCMLDSGVKGAFDPGNGCPTLAQVNAGCHFNLAQ